MVLLARFLVRALLPVVFAIRGLATTFSMASFLLGCKRLFVVESGFAVLPRAATRCPFGALSFGRLEDLFFFLEWIFECTACFARMMAAFASRSASVI